LHDWNFFFQFHLLIFIFLKIGFHGFSRLRSADFDYKFKKLTYFFLKKKLYDSLYVFIRLFQSHKMDCMFDRISCVGLLLISIAIHLSWQFFMLFFNLISIPKHYLFCKKIVQPWRSLVTKNIMN
jgi:hypothetical protein